MRGEITHSTALLIVERLQRFALPSKQFTERASDAAAEALAGRKPTAHQLRSITEAIATSCLSSLLLGVSLPSKGALRDAADRAGRIAVEGVMS